MADTSHTPRFAVVRAVLGHNSDGPKEITQVREVTKFWQSGGVKIYTVRGCTFRSSIVFTREWVVAWDGDDWDVREVMTTDMSTAVHQMIAERKGVEA